MDEVLLRRLGPADAPALRALMLEAYTLCPEAFTSSAAEREQLPLAWWQARVGPGPEAPELVFGAFVGDTLVGAAGLAREPRERTRHKATLFGMYVQAPARGGGLGRRLVEQVLGQARATPGVELVQLTVSEANASALQLYRRCGFESFGTEPMAVKLGERYVAKIHLWRPVGTA